LELLDRLNDQGLTVIVVSHDPDVARRADRILVLIDGRISRRLDGEDAGRVASFSEIARGEK
jgi:putative ABC transport system ATP-binding protein